MERAGIATAHADIRDRKALRRVIDKVAPDGICHLAALTRVRDSVANPLEFFEVNVGGTMASLHALAGVPTPIVFASTGAVYGLAEGRLDENAPTLPHNPYGATKIAAEQLLRYHAQTGAIGATILRCANIAGTVDGIPDTETTRIIPKALAVAAGQAEKLYVNGGGSAVREFTHIADVATAISLALTTTEIGGSRTYNLGSGTGATMLQAIRTVEEITGRTVAVEHLPAKPEPKILMADSSRIRAELNWRPARPTLAEMIGEGWAALQPG